MNYRERTGTYIGKDPFKKSRYAYWSVITPVSTVTTQVEMGNSVWLSNLPLPITSSTQFSPSIWDNHRKYHDKVLVKTSQRTSGGLYSLDELIRSAEEYWVTGKHISAYLEANITFLVLSYRQIDCTWAIQYQNVWVITWAHWGSILDHWRVHMCLLRIQYYLSDCIL